MTQPRPFLEVHPYRILTGLRKCLFFSTYQNALAHILRFSPDDFEWSIDQLDAEGWVVSALAAGVTKQQVTRTKAGEFQYHAPAN